MNPRRRFTPQFKAQVELEVLTGTKSPTQVCREYGLKDLLLCRWKQAFLARAPRLFDPQDHNPCQARIAKLERLRVTALEAELTSIKVPVNGIRQETGPIKISLSDVPTQLVGQMTPSGPERTTARIIWPVSVSAPLLKKLGLEKIDWRCDQGRSVEEKSGQGKPGAELSSTFNLREAASGM